MLTGLLVGHGSCTMGHGSLSAWVTGSWVNASDPLPALISSNRVFENQLVILKIINITFLDIFSVQRYRIIAVKCSAES